MDQDGKDQNPTVALDDVNKKNQLQEELSQPSNSMDPDLAPEFPNPPWKPNKNLDPSKQPVVETPEVKGPTTGNRPGYAPSPQLPGDKSKTKVWKPKHDPSGPTGIDFTDPDSFFTPLRFYA